jgi:ribulose kinase
MSEPNPMAVIARCIEKSKATTDQELIEDYIAEALGVLQIDITEDDAFNMLGSAIVDAVADDEAHTASLFEVWTEMEERRKLS